MKKKLAVYILELKEAAQTTKSAEDRLLYEKYLASAGVILALAVSGAKIERIEKEVYAHERLWGNTWLLDEAYKKPNSAWQRVKEVL